MTPEGFTQTARAQEAFWDGLADTYQRETRISTTEFHYGPLLPGDSRFRLLPADPAGLNCLELGAGAGQNSIALARRGADCLAVDISQRQLAHGRRLAEESGVRVRYAQGDMDSLPEEWTGYDLIHSTYGLPFASDPEAVVATCAERLNPGGVLLISVGHPVYAGEWWDLDGEEGVFLGDYFHPTPDVREGETDSSSQARAFPLSETFGWLTAAGLTVDALLEPRAVAAAETPPDGKSVPYYSREWARQTEELRRFPVVAVFRARKPIST